MAKRQKSAMDKKPPDQKLAELKEQLKRLVEVIFQGDDEGSSADDEKFSYESVRKALETLEALEDWKGKGKRKEKDKVEEEATPMMIPEEFLCPISKELMNDPVVISTGHTYDRRFIQAQLDQGNRACPRSQEALLDPSLIPNHLVREIIAKWCTRRNFEVPHSLQDSSNETAPLAAPDRARLSAALDKLSSPCSSLHDQKSAAKELRALTKRNTSYRAVFGESTDPIPKILGALTPISQGPIDSDLQIDLVTAIFNLSIDEESKKLVGEHPLVLHSLVYSLQHGPSEARRNAAAALFSLSALDSNKLQIAKAGGIKPLIRLLDEGDPMSSREVAQAIFSLSLMETLTSRMIKDGLVATIMEKIRENVLIDELLSILAIFSKHPLALEELIELDGVDCLLQVIRESGGNKRVIENAMALLCSLCLYKSVVLNHIAKDETSYGTIYCVANTGSSRARRKANTILAKLEKIV